MSARDDGAGQPAEEPAGPPVLRVVKGSPTAEETAALVAVLQAVSAAGAAAASPPAPPRSEWASPHRRVRAWLPSGAGGWRSSGLPR